MESSATFTVDVPHSLGVKAAIEKLQGTGDGQVRDMELTDVTANFRAKVDVAFSTREIVGTVDIAASKVSLTVDVSGWVPRLANQLIEDHIKAALQKALG